MENSNNKILVAPLNWGLGHATRCVPIINQLLEKGFEPIIASDGDALRYLEKEFPKLYSIKLPAYNIKYSSKAYFFKFKLLLQIPKIKKAIKKEYKDVQQIIKDENIKGIISDNRFGVYSSQIPSVYITHQINVLSGVATFLTSRVHQKIMKNFDEVWIPDIKKTPRLSGKLSSFTNNKIDAKFIGVLSRFKANNNKVKIKYDVMVLLSGTEPQRTILENKLINELEKSAKKTLFIRGKIDLKRSLKDTKNITFLNFLSQNELQQSILESDLVISRSGYSTIMDLAVLQKKCFFIPTPNQTEQEYLAENLESLKISPFSKQKNFNIEILDKVDNYNGFENKILDLELDFGIFK